MQSEAQGKAAAALRVGERSLIANVTLIAQV